MNVQDCINEGEQLFTKHQLFFGHGTDNAADEALWLVFYQLGLSWESDESVLEQTVFEAEYTAIKALFQRRVDERIPAAYLTGEAWFAGYPFIVNANVLVPRSPLAEVILSGYQPWLNHERPYILDLCTGSGCIGIATALTLPESKVVLSDISPEAVVVAKQNIEKYDLDQRVQVFESDLFAGLGAMQFDMIVSNPPYVDACDLAAMPEEYHAEPAIGLASGEDGLDFTRRLLREAPSYLSEQGFLFVELGNSWENLEEAFPTISFLWLSFEQGGHGVFVITREELLLYQSLFL